MKEQVVDDRTRFPSRYLHPELNNISPMAIVGPQTALMVTISSWSVIWQIQYDEA